MKIQLGQLVMVPNEFFPDPGGFDIDALVACKVVSESVPCEFLQDPSECYVVQRVEDGVTIPAVCSDFFFE